MVLDPLSAVSLASATVQFVDFSARLISNTSEIKEFGKPIQSADLELRAKQLQDLSRKLALTQPRSLNFKTRKSGDIRRSGQDGNLIDITQSCEEIAKELISALNALQQKYANGLFRSFRAALAHVWQEKYIVTLEARLEKYKSDLLTHLMVELTLIQRDQQPIISRMITNTTEYESSLKLLQPPLQSTRDAVISSIIEQADLPLISDGLSRFTYQGTRSDREAEILNSLRFTAMETRKLSIPEAHHKSFTWALEKPSHGTLASWLRDGNGTFWVSGKPGSGKSTLMKHIYEDAKAERYLEAWAGGRRLIKIGFFFWNPGTNMQKSQLGLLRSVLVGFLSQFRYLIPTILPGRWEDTISTRRIIEPWTEQEILKTLDLFAAELSDRVRICLFIDGLDEFEGKPASLIRLVRILSRIPNTKTCVSSRPWNEFEKEYGHQNHRKIYMEQMNRPDMLQYVEDTIGKHSHYQYLRQDGCQDIVTEIVEKSRGVFLWVFLVVRDISQGLDNYDRALDIERRLVQIPADLKDFFKHMMLSLDPIYRVPAAKAFQLAVHTEQPMYMLNYFHLDMEEEDPDYAVNMPLCPLDLPKISELSKLMARRLNARCRGLLETSRTGILGAWFGPKVHFLHRTAKDWMESNEMREMLEEWHSTINIDQAVLRILLAQTKSAIISKMDFIQEGRLTDTIELFTRCAGQIEVEKQTSPIHLIDQFVRVMKVLQELHCPSIPTAPWGIRQDSFSCASFLDYAKTKGLHIYVRAHTKNSKGDKNVVVSTTRKSKHHKMPGTLNRFSTDENKDATASSFTKQPKGQGMLGILNRLRNRGGRKS